MVSRYVLVSTDPADKTIKAGPIMWDGISPVTLDPGTRLMDEATATSSGYAYPAPSTIDANAASLRSKAGAALAANITYLGISAPTNAQVVTQVGRLTRQMNATLRLLLNITDTTDGT